MFDQTRHVKNLMIISKIKKGEATSEILKQYSGWGGLGDLVHSPKIYNKLKMVLSIEEITVLKKTLKNAYYTPKEIVKFIYAWLLGFGFKGGIILEPAVGNGVFIEYMPQDLEKHSKVVAVELDTVTCEIVKQLYPKIQLHNLGFQKFHPNQKFDLIIGNPPYGDEMVIDDRHPDLNNFCIHHYFVAKSMRLLKSGGILSMVLPSYFMDNSARHVRDIIQKEGGNLLSAYRLPDDLFHNAKITVDLVFLVKGNLTQAWTKVRDISVSGMRNKINEFFYQNGGNIFGNLELIDMYGRKALTCKRRGDLTKLLTNEIKRIQYKNILSKKIIHDLHGIIKCLTERVSQL